MKLRFLLVASALALALPSAAQAASSGTFKVSANGKQSLSWSINGSRGSCEIQTGVGSGTSNLSFKSSKSAMLFVSRSGGIVGSLNTKATGERAGAFTETYTACPGFEPPPTYVADASGCGGYSTGVRLDFRTKNAFTWVTGPAFPLPGGACPTFGDFLLSTDLAACGDSSTQYKRSWGLAYGGVGLYITKLGISMKTLLKVKKGKKKTITGKASVDCKPASTFSNPLTIKGELKYSLVFKRTS